MYKHEKFVDKSLLVNVHIKSHDLQHDDGEFQQLALSTGCEVLAEIFATRDTPDSKYFVGLGKAHEIAAEAKAFDATLIIFNHQLSPAQVRNLEKLCCCRVIDRTDLILDIFAARARTFEGKLQVELAQLQHLSTRLIRAWTHLERQKGGVGLRGPGETQLETDRRLIRHRIKTLRARLEKVRAQRQQSRHSRQKANLFTVALVGYTNAGKSTLFNMLTNADVYAQDQLFATLDPTLRKCLIPELGSVVLADTVGFIQRLPHDLVESFKATLEEVRDADLLLHVVDASDSMRDEKIAAVNDVLTQINAQTVPQLVVYNKIDLLNMTSKVVNNNEETPSQVWLSAQQAKGEALLFSAIKTKLADDLVHTTIELNHDQGNVRHQLYEIGAIVNEEVDDQGLYHLEIRLPKNLFQQMQIA